VHAVLVFIDCATNSTWTPKNLSREVVGQQALGNREVQEQRFDQAAISREERLQSRVAISDWNEQWETRGENRNELSLQRGDRSERRNAAKESNVPPPKRTRKKPRNEYIWILKCMQNNTKKTFFAKKNPRI